jgi:hypothetical protein
MCVVDDCYYNSLSNSCQPGPAAALNTYMQKKREQQIAELMARVESSCPYEYNTKLYWIYCAGLYSAIIKRLAVHDYSLVRDLTEIAERNEQKKKR